MQYRRLSISFAAIFAIMVSAVLVSAQLKLPRPSPFGSVTQTIGITDVTINYSRPPVKGRTIFADPPASMAARAKGEATLDNQNERLKGEPIVPYGHVWRTGANDATQFIITDDVTVNGQKLAAGTYSLHTLPGKDEWTIIFNGTANQWGSFSYDPAKDTLRIKAKPQWVNDSQEWMSFAIEPTSDSTATVNLRWDKIVVPFTVAVDVPATTLAKARVAVANAKPDDWRTPFQASGYANQNGAKDDAAKWLNQSLTILDAAIASKPTFQNIASKANVLIAAGRKDEGLEVADKAIAQGKADKADTAAFEKRIADIRAGKN
jgi:hypothetical protein